MIIIILLIISFQQPFENLKKLISIGNIFSEIILLLTQNPRLPPPTPDAKVARLHIQRQMHLIHFCLTSVGLFVIILNTNFMVNCFAITDVLT